MKVSYETIEFTRSSIANILGCTPLTVRNREQGGIYPEPKRKQNNYRYYNLFDVFKLQEITFESIHFGPLFSELWDQGFKDPAICQNILETAKSDYFVSKEGKDGRTKSTNC